MANASKPNEVVVDELRLALATCGAITLVVYESGVCHELERIVREVRNGEPGPWTEAFNKARMTPVIDVLTGASAGGINSVLLGGCLATRQPFNAYRDVWVKKLDAGQMRFGPATTPDAVLNVDGVFNEARSTLLERSQGASEPTDEIDIRLCLTDFDGTCVQTFDALGHRMEVMTQSQVRRFEARDFTDPARVERAAFAARATSAFPGLFSPVEIDGRWFVDGGLWNNQPIDLALEAIQDRKADQRTTRVLLFIEPNPYVHRFTPPQAAPSMMANLLRIPGMGLKGSTLPALEHLLNTNRRKREYDELLERLGLRHANSSTAQAMLSSIRETEKGQPSLLDRIRIEESVLAGDTRRIQAFRSLRNRLDLRGLGAELWTWAMVRLEELDRADLARLVIRREITRYNQKISEHASPQGEKVKATKTKLYGALRLVNERLAGPTLADTRHDSLDLRTEIRTGQIDEAFDRIETMLATKETINAEAIQKALGKSGTFLPFSSPEPTPFRASIEPIDEVTMVLAAISDLESKQFVDLVRISPNDVNNHHLIGREPTGRQTAAQLKLACDGLGHVQGIFDERWRRNDYVWGRLDAAEIMLRSLQRFTRSGSLSEEDFKSLLGDIQKQILQQEADALGTEVPVGTTSDADTIAANRTLIGFGNQEISDAADPRLAGHLEHMIDAARRALNGSPKIAVSGLDVLSRISRVFGLIASLGGIALAAKSAFGKRIVTGASIAAALGVAYLLGRMGASGAEVWTTAVTYLGYAVGAFLLLALGAGLGFVYFPSMLAVLFGGLALGQFLIKPEPTTGFLLCAVGCVLSLLLQAIPLILRKRQAKA